MYQRLGVVETLQSRRLNGANVLGQTLLALVVDGVLTAQVLVKLEQLGVLFGAVHRHRVDGKRLHLFHPP